MLHLRTARSRAAPDVVNQKMGLNSPFKRFAACDMRAVFGVDLIRATIVSPEAESYLRDHEVDLDYANANAHMLPWSLYLADPPVRHALDPCSASGRCHISFFLLFPLFAR
jgi:hypothetical protein